MQALLDESDHLRFRSGIINKLSTLTILFWNYKVRFKSRTLLFYTLTRWICIGGGKPRTLHFLLLTSHHLPLTIYLIAIIIILRRQALPLHKNAVEDRTRNTEKDHAQ